MDGFNRARIDVCRLGAPLRSGHCDHNVTEICPLQSIRVTYTRDRCAYVVDLTLYTAESTAFTRQGSLVQIQPRPPFTSAISKVYSGQSRPYPVGTPHWHTPGTVREQKWPLFVREMDVITSRSERTVIRQSPKPLFI